MRKILKSCGNFADVFAEFCVMAGDLAKNETPLLPLGWVALLLPLQDFFVATASVLDLRIFLLD
jgi:hypothetical protein